MLCIAKCKWNGIAIVWASSSRTCVRSCIVRMCVCVGALSDLLALCCVVFVVAVQCFACDNEVMEQNTIFDSSIQYIFSWPTNNTIKKCPSTVTNKCTSRTFWRRAFLHFLLIHISEWSFSFPISCNQQPIRRIYRYRTTTDYAFAALLLSLESPNPTQPTSQACTTPKLMPRSSWSPSALLVAFNPTRNRCSVVYLKPKNKSYWPQTSNCVD